MASDPDSFLELDKLNIDHSELQSLLKGEIAKTLISPPPRAIEGKSERETKSVVEARSQDTLETPEDPKLLLLQKSQKKALVFSITKKNSTLSYYVMRLSHRVSYYNNLHASLEVDPFFCKTINHANCPSFELLTNELYEINQIHAFAKLIAHNPAHLRYLALCPTKFTRQNHFLPLRSVPINPKEFFLKFAIEEFYLICDALSKNVYLKKIVIDYRFLSTVTNAKHFSEALFTCTSLTELGITGIPNQMLYDSSPLLDDKKTIGKILDALHKLSHIQRLSFNNTLLTDNLAEILSEFLSKNKTLTSLAIENGCECSAISIGKITLAILKHPMILDVVLDYCPPKLMRSTNHKFLPGFIDPEFYPALSNPIADAHYAKTFTDSVIPLFSCSRLRKLELESHGTFASNDSWYFPYVLPIYSALKQNKSLVELELSDSHFLANMGYKLLFKILPETLIIRLKILFHNIKYFIELDEEGENLIKNGLHKSNIESFMLKCKLRTHEFLSINKFIMEIIAFNKRLIEFRVQLFKSSEYISAGNIEEALKHNNTLRVLDIDVPGIPMNMLSFLQLLQTNNTLETFYFRQGGYYKTRAMGQRHAILGDYDNRGVKGEIEEVMANNTSLLDCIPGHTALDNFLVRNKRFQEMFQPYARQYLQSILETLCNCSQKQSHITIIMEYVGQSIDCKTQSKAMLTQYQLKQKEKLSLQTKNQQENTRKVDPMTTFLQDLTKDKSERSAECCSIQ